MNKNIFFIVLAFLSLNINAQKTIAYIKTYVIPPKVKNLPNNGIEIALSTNVPGKDLIRTHGSKFAKWSVNIVLDGKTVYTKQIQPSKFYYNHDDIYYTDGNHGYPYTTRFVIRNTKNLTGNNFHVKVEKEEGVYNQTPLTHLDGTPTDFNLSITYDFFSKNLNIPWTKPFVDPNDDNDDNKPDSDKDGIPDDKDKCPNEAGPASNNGCPVVAKADLKFGKLEKSYLRSSCPIGCGVGGHYIYSGHTNNMDFRIPVINKGNANSKPVYAHIYMLPLGNDNTPFYKADLSYKIPALPPNGQLFALFYFNASPAFFSGGLPVGSYNLEVRLENSPSGNTKAITSMRFPFRVINGDQPNANPDNGIIRLQMLDVNRNTIRRATVRNKEEEMEIIGNLPKGLHIIKTSNGKSRKIIRQ